MMSNDDKNRMKNQLMESDKRQVLDADFRQSIRQLWQTLEPEAREATRMNIGYGAIHDSDHEWILPYVSISDPGDDGGMTLFAIADRRFDNEREATEYGDRLVEDIFGKGNTHVVKVL